MQAERKNITQPAAWWAAFESAAAVEGQTLSEWVGDCCLANLEESTAKKLPERVKRGKPKSTQARKAN